MKLGKRSLLVVLTCSLLVVGIAGAASAQMMEKLAKTTPQERAGMQTAFMKSKLGLQGGELAKVEALNLEFAEKADPIIKGSAGPFMKMREMKSLQQEKDGELQKVLTPQQYSTYQTSRAEMKQKLEEAIAKKVGESQ